ncbi:acyl-CoA reductase-like NAD-dependent aldehyde dehydrogenase [Maritalea mobilis]|uniref:Acyl-CoA reductase-like NAD-dependent aldehyde dehydrogenase n=1 Tax=Maritalea mobilis TaxID=483324 RepID=A0A4R6VK98_9HYPH|nr:aldehyde dehydrogenase family protein [Maritalea mobilis]TDQ62066.1 acyl-CoA reductase-like NAD-dependent aldehyde dehydrogenase [Maritalea mobilis]
MSSYGLVINGEKISTTDYLDVLNPADQSVVGQMPLASTDQLDDAVRAAQVAFPAWRDLDDKERQKLCNQLADKLEAHHEELAKLITAEQGKPLVQLGSRFELDGAIGWSRATAALDLPIEVIEETPDGRVELHRKPIGVVGSITPWNYPVMIGCWHIIPALRAGNTVVIKPSPLTPLSTLRMVELFNEFLPNGVLNAVTGDDQLAAAMSAHPGFNKMVFTGSTATGKKIMASAVDSLKRLTLELGGNDAGIVLPDADPKQAAEGLFWGAFLNNGQTCAALKRLYVHADIYDAVCTEMAAIAQNVKTGPGMEEDSVFGPIQNRNQFEKVKALVDDAKARGARILTGGEPMAGEGNFYPITLVADIEQDARLVEEEQFGPALPIVKYHDVDEAVKMANASPMGLGGSVWSSDKSKAKQIANRLECGSVWINNHGAIQPNAPFGGVKQSGIGLEFGMEGLKEFTVTQTVFV